MSGDLTSTTIKELIYKIDILTSIITTLTTTLVAQTEVNDKLHATLAAQTKANDELQATIAAQTKANDELQTTIATQSDTIKVLEERVNKNSQNSSKPPSSDAFNKPKPKSLRKVSGKLPGAQKGHKGNGHKIMRTPDEVIKHYPHQCEHCSLFGQCQMYGKPETRYNVDIRIDTILTAHKVLSFECPNKNNNVISGSFPDNLNSTMQYGDNLKALAISLNTSGMMGIKRTHDILSSVFGIPISPGTIFSMVKNCGLKLNETVDLIRQKVSGLANAHFDETGLRVDKKLHWVHSASNDLFTYLSVEKKRGTEGMNSSGVLPNFSGVAIHDFWKPYFKYEDINHAVCNAHLLRELTGIIENNLDQTWALDMLELLLQMKKAKDVAISRGKSNLSNSCLEYFSLKFDNVLIGAIQQNPIEPKPLGKRGRPKRGKIGALIDRFVKYKGEVCLFVNDFNIPFDNNQAERDVRMVKVKQKVSGGFRTKSGADTFTTIMSYIGTANKHKIDAFTAIKAAVTNQSKALLFS